MDPHKLTNICTRFLKLLDLIIQDQVVNTLVKSNLRMKGDQSYDVENYGFRDESNEYKQKQEVQCKIIF